MSVVPVILSGRQAFDPRATLFAHNEPGAWYDASDLGTMFTTSDGTTPVTAVEQAVGLILDKSRGLALGPELVSNGDFSNGSTGWGLASGVWSVASGVASTVGGSGGSLTQSISLTAGRSYVVTLDISGWSANTIVAQFTGGTTVSGAVGPLANGRYATIMTAVSGNTTLAIAKNSAATALSVDNISVREIAGTHAIQPTAASRPVLRNRYNLLTYSEDLSNAAWVKADSATVTANVVTAPDGTLTADQVDFAASELSRVQQPLSATSAAYEFSIWLRVASGSVSVRFGHSADLFVITVTSTWQRFAIVTTIASPNAPNITIRNEAGGGAKAIYAWGADLRFANDTIYPYQRIEAATVYDSDASKFPLYLACDGSDDSLYTAANLDLSSTDKLTVFAGVTKLADADSVVLELTAESSSNNGAAAVFTNAAGFTFRAGGTTRVNQPVTQAAPSTRVITGSADIAGDLLTIRIDGGATTNANDQGTGNFASAVLFIGRRNNASIPFNGRIHQLIVRGAASSAAEIASTERYIAGKQGRAL